MQVNSISNSFVRPMTSNRVAQEPVPAQTPEQQVPAEGQTKSIYFGSSDNGKAMRRGTMAVLIPLSILTGMGVASCDKEEAEAYAGVEGYLSGTYEASDSSSSSASGTTVRDTIFVDRTKYDTVYVDTGSYVHDVDTIIQWKDNYQRPIPLDSLMKNVEHWEIDGSEGADIDDGNSPRNIIHYVGTREWEYNNQEIGDMDVLNSSKNVLIYNTEIRDYKGRHESYGKTVLRVPPQNVKLENAEGFVLTNPKGLFLEIYKNDSDDKNADILDCQLDKRFFVQTQGDSVRVYSQNEEGVFVEDGVAAKGYISQNSVLLKNLIGRYDTEDHFVDTHVTAVNDETLKDLYVRKRDEAEVQ